MKIIRLENKDILKIKDLWEALNNHHLTHSTHFKEHFKSLTFERRIKEFKTKDALCIFIVKEDADWVGYCIASLKEQSGEIDSIFINPIHRKKKIGLSLIENAEIWLKEKGVKRIRICVAQGNESAFGFYQKQNYFHRFTVLEKKI